MKKTENKNRTMHYNNARNGFVAAGAALLLVPLTGISSFFAVKAIKETVKEYKVQKKLEAMYAEADKVCEEILANAKAESEKNSEETTEKTDQETTEGES